MMTGNLKMFMRRLVIMKAIMKALKLPWKMMEDSGISTMRSKQDSLNFPAEKLPESLITTSNFLTSNKPK